MTMKFGFGQPLTRKEDDLAFARGWTLHRGRFAGEAIVTPLSCARRMRTPISDRRFRAIRAMPGMHLVLTASDISTLGVLPTPGVLPDVDIKVPNYPILARKTWCDTWVTRLLSW